MEHQKTHNETHRGSLGWLAITAFVVAFDITQEESLSHACSRGLENRSTRPFVASAIGITALHLAGAIPTKLDPFCILIDKYRV